MANGATGNAVAVVTATAGHPFWVHGRQWQDAQHLRPHDQLRTTTGTTIQIVGTTSRDAHATVHNLTVLDIHTYYVLAGSTPVLVHNAGCDEWADAFISASGGQKVMFTPPAGGRVFPEGTYLNQPPGEVWFHHTVVVRDGKVFDQWNPNGISIPDYKAQWGDMADEIDFGF